MLPYTFGLCKCFFHKAPEILFHKSARQHNLMTAPHTPESKISSYTKNLPVPASAWMWFLHCNNITQSEFHTYTPRLN